MRNRDETGQFTTRTECAIAEARQLRGGAFESSFHLAQLALAVVDPPSQLLQRKPGRDASSAQLTPEILPVLPHSYLRCSPAGSRRETRIRVRRAAGPDKVKQAFPVSSSGAKPNGGDMSRKRFRPPVAPS
ncbi:hypothetical protein GCM10010360_34260 [Streptomyces nogalater]